MKRTLLSIVFLSAVPGTSFAAFTQVWQAGFADLSQAEFAQEDGATNPPPGNPNGRDDDYYFAGNYSIGNVATDEPLSVMERALTGTLTGPGDNQDRWHFNLSAANTAAGTQLRVRFDLRDLGYWDSSDGAAGAGTTIHDLNATFNGTPIGSLANVGAPQLWELTFSAGSVGATTGENVLQINRTGGLSGDAPDNIGWIQYDYVSLDADPIPEPGTAAVLSICAAGFLTLRRRRR